MHLLYQFIALAVSCTGVVGVSSACDGLSSTATDSLTENFALVVVNTTIPHTNDTTSQLVLSFGAAETGARLFFLSTFASSPENDFPSFSLSNGTLIANQLVNGSPVGIATSRVVPPGARPAFLVSGALPPGAPIYCAVGPSQPNGTTTLAVNGDTNSFSLCPETTVTNSKVDVVWKADSSSNEYIFDECLPAKIQVMKLL